MLLCFLPLGLTNKTPGVVEATRSGYPGKGLGVHSWSILFNHRSFQKPAVFSGFSRKKQIPGTNGEGTSRGGKGLPEPNADTLRSEKGGAEG